MYKELKTFVEAGKLSEEEANQIHAAYEAEITKARDEAAKYRTAKKELEEELKTRYESELETLRKQIEEAKESGKAEVAQEFETKFKELEAQKNELAQKAKNAVIEATVKDLVGQHEWVTKLGAELIVKNHLTFDDEKGQPLLKLGDELLNPKEGFEKLIETVPDLKAALKPRNNGQGGGAGETPANNPAGAVDPSKMKPEEKAEFIRQHGSDAYLKLVAGKLKGE
jgi:F0F1-type ATP synthase membrane subunit b/b'